MPRPAEDVADFSPLLFGERYEVPGGRALPEPDLGFHLVAGRGLFCHGASRTFCEMTDSMRGIPCEITSLTLGSARQDLCAAASVQLSKTWMVCWSDASLKTRYSLQPG